MADCIDEVISGKTQNLIINVAPGSSKTEEIVINFMARGIALNPRARFLHLSYSDDLALLNSQAARDLVASDEFKELWPLEIAGDTKAKKRWNVLIDGKPAGGVYATSLNGQVTGFRAGHMAKDFQGCFVGETKVQTINGLKRIDEIRKNDIVMSYNHTTDKLEWRPVLAIQKTIRSDIAETIFNEELRIRSTPCHRFYDGKSYRPISQFSIGEHAWSVSRSALAEVSKVPSNVQETARRRNKVFIETSAAYLLFCRVLKSGRQGIEQTKEAIGPHLSNLLKYIPAKKLSDSYLFGLMRKHYAFAKNEGFWQFKLSKLKQRLFDSVLSIKEVDYTQRWTEMFNLRLGGWFDRSPRRPQPREQRIGEFSDALQIVSRDAPQIIPITVSSYKRIGDAPTAVYDIQVEGNHNFFAEGILVHNCIIIDDPMKPEDAFSRTKVNAANRKLLTTVKSRRASPRTPIVIIMQRISDSDCTGFVENGGLTGEWKIVKIPALLDDDTISKFPERYRANIDSSIRDDKGRFSYWEFKEPVKDLAEMADGNGKDERGNQISRHVFSSQYQQAPTQLGGNVIKGEYFVKYKTLPRLKYRMIYADTAQKTKEANDYSVFQCWAEGWDDGKIYLLDQIRGKWEAPELKKRAIAFWHKHKALDPDQMGFLRKLKVEDKSSGTGLVQSIRADGGIPVEGIERNKDKYTRVMDVLPYLESRLVCVPEDAPFTSDYIAEHEAFTSDDTHAHDDQIDPTVDAIADMLSTSNKLKIWERVR